MQGRCAATVVICVADIKPLQAVVPAHARVDLALLGQMAGPVTLRLATEAEIEKRYPEFEVGAAPPFGTRTAIVSSWRNASSLSRRWFSTREPTPHPFVCTTLTSLVW